MFIRSFSVMVQRLRVLGHIADALSLPDASDVELRRARWRHLGVLLVRLERQRLVSRQTSARELTTQIHGHVARLSRANL